MTAASLAAQQRRQARFNIRIESLANNVVRLVRMTMNQRLRLAAQLLRDQIVINISRPVRKLAGGGRDAGGRRISRTRVDPGSRSRPGEFPRADTTRLMKDIFFEVDETRGVAMIGTTLDYGLYLETRMQRSFLSRTLTERQAMVTSILTAQF